MVNGRLLGCLVVTVHAEPSIVMDHEQPVTPSESAHASHDASRPGPGRSRHPRSPPVKMPAALCAVLVQRLPFTGNERPSTQVVVSRFARQERVKVVFGDQPTPSCPYRPELAGTQQVMDELSGDAQ